MDIKTFFDKQTSTLTYVAYDSASRDAVIIDPVLDFNPASGRISRSSAEEVLAFVRVTRLNVRMVLETHAHADHLSSSQLLREALPGQNGMRRPACCLASSSREVSETRPPPL